MKLKLTFLHKQPSFDSWLKRWLTSLMFRYSSCAMCDNISRRSSSGTLSKGSRVVIDELERNSSSQSLILSPVERWTERRATRRDAALRTLQRKTAKLVLILTNACEQEIHAIKGYDSQHTSSFSFPKNVHRCIYKTTWFLIHSQSCHDAFRSFSG